MNKTKTFTLEHKGRRDLDALKNMTSTVNLIKNQTNTPKHIKLISGVGHSAGHRGPALSNIVDGASTAKSTN